MKHRSSFPLLLVALALLAAMILTLCWGRESRHGYGLLPGPLRGPYVAACFP